MPCQPIYVINRAIRHNLLSSESNHRISGEKIMQFFSIGPTIQYLKLIDQTILKMSHKKMKSLCLSVEEWADFIRSIIPSTTITTSCANNQNIEKQYLVVGQICKSSVGKSSCSIIGGVFEYFHFYFVSFIILVFLLFDEEIWW